MNFRMQSLAQRYAEERKETELKIVGYAADSILQVFVAKIKQEDERGVNAQGGIQDHLRQAIQAHI